MFYSKNKKGMCPADFMVLSFVISSLIISGFYIYPEVRLALIFNDVNRIYSKSNENYSAYLSSKKISNEKGKILGTAFSYKGYGYSCKQLSNYIISKFPDKISYLHIEKNNINVNNKDTVKSQIEKSCNKDKNKDYISSVNFLLKN